MAMTKQELEFLPAVLEIQESPPSPLGRAIAWSLIIFFSIALLWAILGRIDIVAVAQGKIIPSGHVQVIQPLEIGVVRALHVSEGQAVNQGDVLVELDPTASGADQQRLAEQLTLEELRLARLQLQMQSLSSAQTPKLTTTGADPHALALQQNILTHRLDEYRARRAMLENIAAEREAERSAIAQEIEKLQQILPLVTQRAQAYEKQADKAALGADPRYLELEQERIEQGLNLAMQRQRLKQSDAASAAGRQQLAALEAEFKRITYNEQADAERMIAELRQELIKAKRRTALQRLTAPITGVVQQLALHTVGGVVTSAQTLMVIVPETHALEVHALVQNKDIGFIHEGQRAEIKIEAFPFTKYGTLDAEIQHVSRDAIEDQKQGLVYAARVAMKRTRIQVEDTFVNLRPGMTVTVEIKTGQRRLIEYFLSPLLRYQDESVRER